MVYNPAMPLFHLPMLAITTEELIMAAIGLIIVVGSWLSNTYKRRQESSTSHNRPAPTASSADTSLHSQQNPAARLRAQQQAAQRRAQLQELARQRREALRGVEPDNLTMADAQQRAQAQAAYEQRAQQLRQLRQQQTDLARPQSQTPASPTTLPGASARPGGPAALPHHMRQQQRQAQIERQRQLARAQQREQARRLELQRQRQALQQQQAAAQRGSAAPSPPTMLHASSTAPVSQMPTDIASLRQAFIMKEVLDRPLALRESPDPYDQW